MLLLWQTKIIFRREHNKLECVMTTCCNYCEGGAEFCILCLKLVVQCVNSVVASCQLGHVAERCVAKYCRVLFEKLQVSRFCVARLHALWSYLVSLTYITRVKSSNIKQTPTHAIVLLNHHFINTLLLQHVATFRQSSLGTVKAAIQQRWSTKWVTNWKILLVQ